jgi:hypothetical protein
VNISPPDLFPEVSTIGAAVERAAKPARATAHQYFIMATERSKMTKGMDYVLKEDRVNGSAAYFARSGIQSREWNYGTLATINILATQQASTSTISTKK